MKNRYIVSIIIGLAMIVFGLVACQEKPSEKAYASHDADSSMTRWTKPVNAQVIATIPVISPEGGTRIYTSQVNGVITYDTRNQTSIASKVGGRIERLLIKYNYQPVRKGQLIMEVYAPDLAAAQRELLYIAANGGELLAQAKQRLQLLGMPPALIEQVLKTRSIIYRIPVYSNSDGYILEKTAAATATPTAMAPAAASGDGMGGMETGGATPQNTTPSAAPAATPVLLREGQYVSAGQSLFTIYQASSLVAEFAFPSSLAANIRRGQKLLFYPANNKDEMQTANIGLIEPVFRNGQNFTLARVYLGDHKKFRVGQLLNGHIPIVYATGWWLPKQAVGRLGGKSIVFRKENDVYVPVEVATMVTTNDMIQVMTNISDWKVAENAAYLVDSESFIKTNNKLQ
jgi:Cu(I)/Ag(I) efflux system membrane fusion protein